MRPKPFRSQSLDGDNHYVRDTDNGTVWHRCEMRTLYADTDRSQVVYHANYLRYFEHGRASLMRATGYPYREIEARGYVYPIIKVDIDYYRPLYYDDAMYIYTRPALLERVRLQFDYLITPQASEELVCSGLTRHCAVNSTGKPVEIDEITANLWKVFPK